MPAALYGPEIMEFRKSGPEMVVMSAFGRSADWLRNIEATPNSEVVVVGSTRFAATHRILNQNEAENVIAGYERRNRLIAPIIRAVLSRLPGWKYDGSERSRRQLAGELRLIAFRPRS